MRWMATVLASVVGVAALGIVAMPARAQVWVGGAGGVFVPYKGQAGPSGLLQGLGGSDKWRFGGELEYRNYKSSIFDVDNVSFNSISFRGVVQYHFGMAGVHPYVGGGVGVNVNIIDSSKVERESPVIVSVSDAGAGLGVLGLAGVEIPLASRVSLFGEARASVDFQLTNQGNDSSNDIGVENLGGFTGIGGIRVQF